MGVVWVPFSIHAVGDQVVVTTRPKLWNTALQAVSIAWWSLISLGLGALAVSRGGLSVWGWFALAASLALVVIAVAGIAYREVIHVSSNEARGYVEVFGLRFQQRTATMEARRFSVLPKPKFFSWRDSAPWIRLTDSAFKFGHGELTYEQADAIVVALNSFLDTGALASAPSSGPA